MSDFQSENVSSILTSRSKLQKKVVKIMSKIISYQVTLRGTTWQGWDGETTIDFLYKPTREEILEKSGDFSLLKSATLITRETTTKTKRLSLVT